MKSKVFVSYKHVDKDKVVPLVRQLEAKLGIRFWIDMRGIECDGVFDKKIIKAINLCEVFLFIYSNAHKDIMDSDDDYTVKEINFAKTKKKRIVFIDLEGATMPDRLIFDFPKRHITKAHDKYAINKLIDDMSKWLNLKLPDYQNNNLKSTVKDSIAPKLIAVDLGLPSGIKWASCNVGAEKPEEPGGYYALGETKEKEKYDWSTYEHCDGDDMTSNHDIGNSICGTKFDVANMKSGGIWQMPSMEHAKELINECSHKWKSIHGIPGCEFTGPNGNSIFLPAAGIRIEHDLVDKGLRGNYWLGDRMDSKVFDWSGLYLSEGQVRSDYFFIFEWDGQRCYGRTIRPILAQ